MELVGAGVVLALLVSFFISIMGLLRQAQDRAWHQEQALNVLDNTLERLARLKQPDQAQVRQIFEDEFSRNGLAEKDGFVMNVEPAGDRCELRILWQPKNWTLARVHLPGREPEAAHAAK